MNEKEQKIIEKVFGEFIGYWSVDDARQYAPLLFPFVEPEQKVRDALKALNCKKDKDERFKASRSSVETDRDSRFIREIEYLLEREEMQYKKRFPEGERRDYRDLLMMLIPTIAAQKGNISVSLDVNQLNTTIYGECNECPIRETCKEAFSVVNEYVSSALKKLDFEVPSKEG